MGHKKRAFQVVVGVIMFVHCGNANADYSRYAAVLNCDADKSRVMIRFPAVWNDDPISKAKLPVINHPLYQELSAIPVTEGTCTLKNDQKFEVTITSSQAFAYGAGGADPDAQFTMKVNGEPIYTHRTFYRGYGKGEYAINAIIFQRYEVQGKHAYTIPRLAECRPGAEFTADEFGQVTPKKSVCFDATDRLESYKYTRTGEEIAFEEKMAQREALEKKLSPFCHEFREASKETDPERYKYGGIIGHVTQDGGSPPFLFGKHDEDINNDTKDDVVYSIGGGTHYFDGNYLVVFAKEAAAKKFEQFMLKTSYKLDESIKGIKYLPEWGGYLINVGNSPRYTYNAVTDFKGKNYVYSRYLNSENIPSATLSLLDRSFKLERLCEFP